GARREAMATLLQPGADAFVVVELPVDHDVHVPVLVRDRLIAGLEVDDAQPCVPQSHVAVGRHPVSLPVGSAVMECPGRCEEGWRLDRTRARENGYDAAHGSEDPAGRRGESVRRTSENAW